MLKPPSTLSTLSLVHRCIDVTYVSESTCGRDVPKARRNLDRQRSSNVVKVQHGKLRFVEVRANRALETEKRDTATNNERASFFDVPVNRLISLSLMETDRLSETRELVWDDGSRVTRSVYHWDEPQAPSFRFEHDKEKKLLVLTWPDGRIERFRDNPARQLMVEPDPVTGELRPAIKQGEPVYMYVCREEREIR